MHRNITKTDREAVEATCSGDASNCAPFSCSVAGEPASAITMVGRESNGCLLTSLFVRGTPKMTLLNHYGGTMATPPLGNARGCDTSRTGGAHD